MRKAFVLVGLLWCSATFAAPAQNNGPGGISATCPDVLVMEPKIQNFQADSVVFNVKLSDWTPESITFLKGLVERCANEIGWQHVIDYQKNAIDQLAAIPAQQRAIEDKKAAEASKKMKAEACEASKEKALYDAQESVISDLELLQGWRDNQAHEQRVARVSGVRDLAEERNNGAWIVQTQDELKTDFGIYKRLGGKARSPQQVKHQLEDPCRDFR